MARSQRNSKLENRSNRLKLKAGTRHYLNIAEGVALGYRRTKDGYGNWQVRVYMPDGRYQFAALGAADDMLDANGAQVFSFFQAQAAARQQAESMRNPKTAGKQTTVSDAAAEYLDWYQRNRKAFRETKASIDAHILPALGDTPLAALTTQQIKAWHDKLAHKPARVRTAIGRAQQFRAKPTTDEAKRARKSTANRVLVVLKAILNRAFENELVADDTAWRRVRPFERTDEPISRFLTAAESKRLINACSADFRNLVKAALLTGARYSELTRLRASDFNRDTAMLHIRPESKSGKGRYVPLNDEGLVFFSDAQLSKRGSDILFTRSDGKPWGKNHQVRSLNAACDTARIDPAISFHELRHTYASLLAQSGADLLTISKLLGHADTRITARHYAHLCDRTLANAVRAHLPGFGHVPTAKVRAMEHK